ncbi:MAG: hypothetical protein ACRD2Z_07260 [Thermoanaerobaculia bacterium]
MTAEEAIEGLLPLAEKLAKCLVPDAEWAYARRGPTSCELKGEPDSYQYAHRFALSSDGAPGGTLPSTDELLQRATSWLEAEDFRVVAGQEPPSDDVFLLSGTGEAGRVTVAAGPQAILVSLATHPLPSREVAEAATASVH